MSLNELLYDGVFETEAQQEVRSLARKYAKDRVLPLIEHDELHGVFRPEIIKGLGELGLTGVSIDEKYGGAGLGSQEYIGVIEEIAAVSASYAISIAVTGLPQMILQTYGNDQQRNHYIPRLASGDAIGAFSLSEASSGSDAASLRTVAVRDGQDYVINGTKLWTTQADSADVMILMARTGGPGAKGVSAFILEKNTPGITMGKREKKMGLHISHTMEVVLENARVPAKNLIGKEGSGMKVALSALDSGRITIAATALGIARSAIEVATHHAQIREQFGKPILEFQGVGFILADLCNAYASAKLIVQRAAALRDLGKPYSLAAAQAKTVATDMAMKVTTDAVQILGGSGYTQDFPAERFMREAKVLQIVEGTNQIQRLVIARSLKPKA